MFVIVFRSFSVACPCKSSCRQNFANFKLTLPSFLPLWSFPVPTHNSLSYESDHSGRTRPAWVTCAPSQPHLRFLDVNVYVKCMYVCMYVCMYTTASASISSMALEIEARSQSIDSERKQKNVQNANKQGHPTSIFGKYLFRRRFEI